MTTPRFTMPKPRRAHAAEVDDLWHDRDAEGLLLRRPCGRRCACPRHHDRPDTLSQRLVAGGAA